MSISATNSQSIDDPMLDVTISSISRHNPFPDVNSFQRGIQYLTPSELSNASKVCIAWNKAIEQNHVWKNLTIAMRIPLVVSLDGRPRKHKADFKQLYPITVSGFKLAQVLGDPVGKTASISERHLLMLSKSDPFEQIKTMGKTFRFVCMYSFIERTFDGTTPLTLEEGTLVRHTEADHVEFLKGRVKIPLSLKNERILSLYPLKGQNHTPVFNEHSWTGAFDQCDTCPRGGVYFMRDQIAPKSRNKSWDDQLALVKAKGLLAGLPELAPTPLAIRVHASVMDILNGGKCSDSERPAHTFARAPDVVFGVDTSYRVVGGHFVAGVGLLVCGGSLVGFSIGVAPGEPAAVR